MKRILMVVLILALPLLCAGALAEADTTLLVYLCGADIQSDACEDIYEMGIAETGQNVNIVILAGGAETWDFDELSGRTRNLVEIRDGAFESITDWGWASMGSGQSLLEFLEYGLKNYPARRTGVILWDHGAGSEAGICFDSTTQEEDGLTLLEINQALSDLENRSGGFHLDFFGCDACMMATYEMAAVLSHYNIGYYVASEELEPGNGWYYTDWLKMLKDDPSVSDEDLCKAIIDSYLEKGLQTDPNEYMTLSAVKLSEIGALESSMERFASVMSGEIEGGRLSDVRRGRSRMYTFGSFDDGSWDMVDLGAVLDAYAAFDAETAAEAKRCLSKAVIASSQTDNLDPCSGLSILLPQDTTESFDEYRAGFALTDVIPNWVDFVNGYVKMLLGGSYHFTASAPQISSASSFEDNTFVSASACPSGFLSWDDAAECYAEEESYADEVSILDTDEGFSAVIPQEDLAYLDSVEGMLLMDMSDEEMECYVDFGSMQNNLIDWKTGTVVSLYDGTWPIFGGMPVPLYDQTSNEHSRRSLIPVKLNGEYTYLVVVFPAGGTVGQVVGANAGYDDNGLPIRQMTKLKDGDEIQVVYTMYYEEEGKEDLAETEYEGDTIIWQDGMTVTYEDLTDDDDEPFQMLFCFVFNDIFGGDSMSEMISFEL